ncbi:MAG: UDP-N-acetylglucosamine 2-epimerase (non-hydrolyzing) [Eubacteriales bacterium]
MSEKKIKIMTVFGTRPEAIKMASLVKTMESCQKVEHRTCVSAQHRDMLDQVLDIFNIKPDFDLDIFQHGQSLTQITSRTMEGMEEVFKTFKPDLILVQGDTTTVFSGALVGFYHKIKIGHVEAGLRSGNLMSPYPEEANRKLTGVIANFHFAPTKESKENLLKEGYDEKLIHITGNTVIDALFEVVDDEYEFEDEFLKKINFNNRILLLTAHRRENIGKPMENIFKAVKRVVNEQDDVEVIYPVHLNPKVRKIADNILKDVSRVHLIEPLDYVPFANLMNKSHIIVTDSGGIQEEAPSLGKPVIVVRKETERPEGIKAGTAKLAGTDEKTIYKILNDLLNNEKSYKKMANAVNPYGDGKSAHRIKDIILESLL